MSVNIASCYCFDVETHAEFPIRVTLSMHGIVGGVARDCNLVVKLNIAIFFLVCLLVKTFMLTKISHYTVC